MIWVGVRPARRGRCADVVNHLVGGQLFFTAMMNGEPPRREQVDFASGDFLAAFDQGAAASVAAFESDGAMERTVHLPFADLPGAVFVGIAATDTFVHGWDIAKAMGRPTDLDPDLAAALLGRVGPLLSDVDARTGRRGPVRPGATGAGGCQQRRPVGGVPRSHALIGGADERAAGEADRRRANGPVVMLNLVHFRDQAADGDGSGRDAYQRYSRGFIPLLKRGGGTILWAGDVTGVAIGDDVADAWDYAVLVMYPDRQTFVDTVTSDDYRAINHHRLAGLDRHVILPVSETYSKFADPPAR